MVKNLLTSIKYKRKKQADIIIDDWSGGVLSHFYGEELVGELTKAYKCNVFDFNKVKIANAGTVFGVFVELVKCMVLANRIIKHRKVDLRRYIYIFYSAFLSGIAIRKLYRPKLVISGNHNGFSIIRAKAAGAKIIMIPNGWFGLTADASFLYANHFISMGKKYIIEPTLKNGCVFENIHPFGSLRLHNFNQKTRNCHFDITYDLLWGSSGMDLFYDNSPHYSLGAEYEAIKLINKYAAQKGVRVAYHCRFEDEVEKLKKLGLYSEKIDYLPSSFSKKPKSVYAAIKESKVVVSSFSSICHEAFALGKKFAFVNMSGNAHLTEPYRNANVEYNMDTKISFDEFIGGIKNRNIDPEDYVVQNPNYVKDLLAIVDGAVKRSPVDIDSIICDRST